MENTTILTLQEKFDNVIKVSRPELTMDLLYRLHSDHNSIEKRLWVKLYEDYNYVRSMNNYPDLKMWTGSFNLIECVYYIDVVHSVKEKECQPVDQKLDMDQSPYLLQSQIYHHLLFDANRKEYNEKMDKLLDQIGCWSIDTIQFENEWIIVFRQRICNEIPLTDKEFQILIDSLESNQTIYVALKDHRPDLLFTNDVYVMRDNLLPFITHLYLVEEIGTSHSPTKSSSEIEDIQPSPHYDESEFKLTTAEFNNQHVGQIGKVIIITDETDLDELLSDITRDADSGKSVWYKTHLDLMYRLINPRQIDAQNLGNAEKIVVIPNKDITKKEETDSQALWNMQLHESIKVANNVFVLRVPGGWIYELYDQDVNKTNAVFVPFNNEFMQ